MSIQQYIFCKVVHTQSSAPGGKEQKTLSVEWRILVSYCRWPLPFWTTASHSPYSCAILYMTPSLSGPLLLIVRILVPYCIWPPTFLHHCFLYSVFLCHIVYDPLPFWTTAYHNPYSCAILYMTPSLSGPLLIIIRILVPYCIWPPPFLDHCLS